MCMVHRFAFSEEEEDWPRSRTCLVIFTNPVNYEFRAKVKHTRLDGLSSLFHQSQPSLLVGHRLSVTVKTMKDKDSRR